MNGNLSRWIILTILSVVILILAVFLPYQISRTQYPNGSELDRSLLLQQVTATRTTFLSLLNADQVVLAPTRGAANPTLRRNCTFTALYWLGQQEAWPYQVIINDLNYTQDEALGIVEETPLDVSGVLFVQFHSAYLNILSGADPSAIRKTILDASDWLSLHPSGSALTADDQQRGLELTRLLLDYNSGSIGPGLCSDQFSANNSQSASILTPDLSRPLLLSTATQTGTATLLPTFSSTSGSVSTLPAQTQNSANPTATRGGNNNPTQGATAAPATRTPVPTQPPTAVATTQPTARPTSPPPTSTQPPLPTSPPPTDEPPRDPTPTSPPAADPPPTSPP